MAAKKKYLTREQIAKAYQEVKKAEQKELEFWCKKIKLLRPQKGDILIVPSEAHFNFGLLSEALKLTSIKYALVVPGGNASLMDKEEALEFAHKILKEANGKRQTARKTRGKTTRRS